MMEVPPQETMFGPSDTISDIRDQLETDIGRLYREAVAAESVLDWIQFQRKLLDRMLWLFHVGSPLDLTEAPRGVPSSVQDRPTPVYQARAVIEVLDANDDITWRGHRGGLRRKDVEEMIDAQFVQDVGQRFTTGASRLFNEVLERDHEGFGDTLRYLWKHREDIRSWSEHLKAYGGYEEFLSGHS
jgi:hypothetical protein